MQADGSQTAPPRPDQLRLQAPAHGHQIDDRGGLERAGSGLDHSGQFMFLVLTDLARISQRLALPRQDQRGRQQGRSVLLQQGL